jgi:peptidyl-Asp metalloendopeptidase
MAVHRLTHRTLVVTLLAAIAAIAGARGQQPPPPLFTGGNTPPPEVRSTVKRARNATVTLQSFDAVPASKPGGPRAIELNLFDDARYVAELQQIKNATPAAVVRWVGTLRQQPDSSVVLSERGRAIAANIRTTEGRMFQIRPTGEPGAHVIEELNSQPLPRDAPSRIPPPEPAPGVAADPVACADSDTLDVMVAYTKAALTKVGGLAAMNGLIDLGEIEANKGYEDSRMTQRIRIVERVEVAYDESTGYDAALEAITGMSDGKMDNIHALRNQRRADLVSLWIDNPDWCGKAWQMPAGAGSGFASKAFSTVNVDCATGYYSFAHEMGHNQGADHDRKNAAAPSTFAFGYCLQHPSDPLFRTIMAYACASVDCPRINLWSNPAVTYKGVPTGVAEGDPNAADNHLALERTRTIAAKWRCSKS